jgi:hypothetical protein
VGRPAHRRERGTALAVVLDRVPPEASAEIAEDLAGMLQRAQLDTARLFVVEERPLVDGGCPRTRSRRCATGCTAWPPTRRSAPPSSGRRCRARSTA